MVNDQQRKVIELIKNDSIKEALELIKKSNAKELLFEKAYCYYRQKRYQDCHDLLLDIDQHLHVKELLAQTLYRLARYRESYTIYLDLIKNSVDDYEDERETNLAAVVACMLQAEPGSLDAVPDLGDHMYELLFNKACIELANKSYQSALTMLLAAEKLCRKTLQQEEASDEEIESELGIIRAQLGYVYQRLGDHGKALDHYNKALATKPTDITQLTDLEISAIDVDALEESNWSLGAKYVKKTVKGEPLPPMSIGDEDMSKSKKKRRKRKTILPKHYDPSCDPDPERWLPRWQRSNYKKKKDKKDAIGKGTQGAVGGSDVTESPQPGRERAKDSPQPGPRLKNRNKGGKKSKGK